MINAPDLWWCERESVEAGAAVSLSGRNLSQRPDFGRTLVYLAQAGKPGIWLKAVEGGKYRVRVALPKRLEPGSTSFRVHAGNGGKMAGAARFRWRFGRVAVQARPRGAFRWRESPGSGRSPRRGRRRNLADSGGNLNLAGTLIIPAKVHVAGAGIDRTVLISPSDPAAPLASASGLEWNRFPDGVHSKGDEMATRCISLHGPLDGLASLWNRHGPYGSPGVSKHMTLSFDGGEPGHWTIFPIRAVS